MYTGDIAKILSDRESISQEEAHIFVESMFDMIAKLIAKEEPVCLSGFGTFRSKGRKRSESIHSEDRFMDWKRTPGRKARVVYFRPSYVLTNAINLENKWA